MDLKPHSVVPGMAGVVLSLAISRGSSDSEHRPTPNHSPGIHTSRAPAAAAAPAPAPVWSVGTIDFSGYLDGYFSYNNNRPAEHDQ